jgi:DNA-directed RNA polymerase specialized sigma24 family protein
VDDAKLKAARAGNARARAAVLRALQDGWFRYALSQLLSVSAARDATQEAGLRVLQRLSAFDGGEPVEDWSLAIVATAVRDLLQLGGQPPPLLAAARRAGLPPDPPRFSRAAADAADGLSAVLAPLAPAQREAVVLRLVERRSAAAVARLLATDPATVRADASAGAAAVDRSARRLAEAWEQCRDWSAVARYPGDLRAELFRAHKPAWLVPAALGTLAASVVLIGVAHRYRPPATRPAATGPATTRPTTRSTMR